MKIGNNNTHIYCSTQVTFFHCKLSMKTVKVGKFILFGGMKNVSFRKAKWFYKEKTATDGWHGTLVNVFLVRAGCLKSETRRKSKKTDITVLFLG